MKLDDEFMEQLHAIQWFCRCGTSTSFEWEWAAPAGAIKMVLKAIASPKWENMVLGARGDVTEQLSIRSIKGLGREYQEWNSLVLDFKERHLPRFKSQWEPALENYGLNTRDVVNDVSFNVLSIVVIDAYKDWYLPRRFWRSFWRFIRPGIFPVGGKARGKMER